MTIQSVEYKIYNQYQLLSLARIKASSETDIGVEILPGSRTESSNLLGFGINTQ